jgi:hypothetical protein
MGLVNCLNCDHPLTGRYCSACGQKHDPHAQTVGHFLAETFETLTHADSRLWLTLRVLLTRPGNLTADFFAGRRNRYMPAIRLYIVISVLFFLLMAIVPGGGIESLLQPGAAAEKPSQAIELDGEIDAESCKTFKYNGPFEQTIEPRLRAACIEAVQDNGRKLGEIFQRNVPKAMFVLLPAFALLMLPFFWHPRRLYAEHLIFLVHNHTAIFAALTIEEILDFLIPAGWDGWLGFALLAYVIWYGWRGLRVYYGKSRGKSLALFTVLGLAYVVLAAFVITFTGIASMLAL